MREGRGIGGGAGDSTVARVRARDRGRGPHLVEHGAEDGADEHAQRAEGGEPAHGGRHLLLATVLCAVRAINIVVARHTIVRPMVAVVGKIDPL